MHQNRFSILVSMIFAATLLSHCIAAAQESSPASQAQNAFKFRVKWDGRYIPGITKVGGLTRRTEAVTSRSGGDPSQTRKSPGLTAYKPIVLERPRTHAKEFEQWANKVWNFGSGLGSEVSLRDFRKDVVIELYNEAGQLTMAFRVYRCWPSEYKALSDLDSGTNAPAIETITLEHEGWERDAAVAEPAEP
jgi:phage tail-like protein